MQKEIELFLNISETSQQEKYKDFIAKELGIKTERIKSYIILKKTLDARNKYIKYHFRFKVFVDEDVKPETDSYKRKTYHKVNNKKVVYIIGSGPAGLFAALEFIKIGIKPIIFERGKTVNERKKDIALLNREHILNTDSNYCFGEGGAGTFSDGKLYTRTKKKGDISVVFQTFVEHGANPEILYDAYPHIGTDVLPRIILSIRKYILEYGGEIHFKSKLTDVEIKDHKIKSITINENEQIPVDFLILATGHSARDIYELLHRKKIMLEPKPFALGVRVEHPQELINSIQYHGKDYDKNLAAAQYKLAEQVGQRGVFSFCMCPGGIIVPSATENKTVVVNGMSNSRRNSPYANAGIVVQVNPSDKTGFEAHGALHLLYFQDFIEKSCFVDKALQQIAPAQKMTDFVKGKLSLHLPHTSYKPGVKSCMLEYLLPSFITSSLKQAFVLFDKKMRGYYTEEALLLATESRTSSPVRITRNANYEHVLVKGLYPAGEGSGYAGGITSSAIDGINIAKEIAQHLI